MNNILRRLMAAVLALAAALGVDAQSAQEVLGQIGQKIQSHYAEYNEALYNKKDYAEAERLMVEVIALNESMPDSLKAEFSEGYRGIKGNLHYDAACMYSLDNKVDKALECLSIAYENGWHNYKHAAQDNDLINIRGNKRFEQLLNDMRDNFDYEYILHRGGAYKVSERRDTLPRITYADASNPGLEMVRRHFRLDSVAAGGDEISKIKRILTFIHNRIRHDGMHSNPGAMNAIDLDRACADGSRGLNCRGLATVLNECFLAMGFKSRFITCFPRDYKSDCHVINVVYSRTLKRWIWIDPTHNAWITDENGNLLGVKEVRERRLAGLPYVLNEEANWNNETKSTKEYYLDEY
ncbi:MAG: transglutaminase domain-containing protein, partial [Muribaculaceae bacterium]|nr:transglutaminase domain-containing protein [Muribaculaceae bacterium]